MDNKNKNAIGMIGLGTMGSNLLENIAEHGFSGSGYDIDTNKVDALNKLDSEKITGFSDMGDFIESLKSPKIVMLLVPAGEIVDTVIDQLKKHLEKGDLIIDGGNSHFTDTERRYKALEQKGFHFIGMGVSGGEEGARKGPSLMPGGAKEAYKQVEPILKKIAAQVEGDPMVAYMGDRSAGHFVKMVHNGIEYAIMQLISETYEILKSGLNYTDSQIHDVFKKWNEGRLESYLLDITRDIFAYRKEGEDTILLETIRDQAKAKGTGKWTSQAAMDLHLPVPIIDIAVAMRDLSTFKKLRTNASQVYSTPKHIMKSEDQKAFFSALEPAFYFAMVSAYAQGMHLFSRASQEFDYNLNLKLIANIWRGGCIIRSKFLKNIYAAYQKKPDLTHLFLDGSIQNNLQECIPAVRKVVSRTALQGIATPAFSAALNYFDNFRSESMPTNLIQAQRDYFGSHTYELKGKKGVFHSKWVMENKEEIEEKS
ncbi:MAG TPA: NADP-dependent phosphogluconate dehydrogenase [Aequorivita sp.]|nr:NADP-dependent phosphogluconate dehydrogenase [Aequorivita sp.]